MGGCYFDHDINHEFRFVWTATEEGSMTGYDEYYRALGASALRQVRKSESSQKQVNIRL